MKWHAFFSGDGAQKLIKSKLGNIRKKFLSCLKPFCEIWWTQNLQFLSCTVGNTVGPIHLKF
ncbi:hypothetical protein O3M35_004258 [Rhynocoris fuscipes]|uniref:Uncharacterized protein n=1 Tax=Rhynocoris fuscipes TaxID=488301 RepID=A0AAW1CIU1_9HEMI